MATISVGATTITPLLILNSDRERDTRNVILEPIDSPVPYVSLAESATPTQQLVALFADEIAAQAALDLVSRGLPIAVVTDARTFSCVKTGSAKIDRAGENRSRWTLTLDVRELA